MPDNNELVKNRPLEDCAELLEYVIHKVQRVTINYMRTIKKKINNDRQEIVEELDKLLDKNDNDAQNIEAIEELQSELNGIDAKKEREFLSLKSSWDILEKEKNRREFIKLESLRAGYHDPTIMRIYVKKIDMTLPAPHEKCFFFTLLNKPAGNKRRG